MDRMKALVNTDSLSKLVQQEVSAYAGEAYGVNGPTRLYYTENTHELVYCITVPYDPVYQKSDLVLMARIVDDQVIIDVDKTGKPLRGALRQAGIPDYQIRLAWDQST
jgi:hypothetical protein